MVERRIFRTKRKDVFMHRRINPQFRLRILQKFAAERSSAEANNQAEVGEIKNENM